MNGVAPLRQQARCPAVDVLQVLQGLVVLEFGRQSLPALPGQLLLLVPGQGGQQGPQPALLQLVHILLLLPEDPGGLLHPGLPLRPLLLQVGQLGLQPGLAGQVPV